MRTQSAAMDPGDLCQIFTSIGKGVLVWAPDQTLLACNDLWLRLNNLPSGSIRPGQTRAEVIGAVMSDGRRFERADRSAANPLEFDRAEIRRVFETGEPFRVIRMVDGAERIIDGHRIRLGNGMRINVIEDVTERERRAERLAAQSSLLRTIFESIQDGVAMLEADGAVAACNGRFHEILETGRAEGEGGAEAAVVQALQALGEDAVDASASADADGAPRMTRSRKTGRPIGVVRTRLGDGRTLICVRDESAAVEIARRTRMLRTILDNIDDGVTLTDRDGRLIDFNARVFQLYDMDPGDIAPGDTLWKLVRQTADLSAMAPEEAETVGARRIAFALAPENAHRESVRRLRNGRTVRIRRSFLEDGDVVSTCVDVTAEAERARMLEQARAAALAANTMSSEFLARMSHDLRAPMNGVLGMAALLAQEPLDDRQKKLLGVIEASGRHMMKLVEDLLDSSVIEAGEVRLTPAETRLSELLGDCAAMVRARAEARGLEMRLDLDLPADFAMRVDATRLTQILVNLLINAVKFTERGGVALSARLAERAVGTVAALTVADTGCGIPADQHERIFERFTRLRDSGEGAGLGLSIARALTRLMGGELTVRSAPGQGAAFTVELPVEAADR